MQSAQTFFLGLVNNLLTALIVFIVGIVLSYFLDASLEAKLAICNMALLLSTIILILSNRFYNRRTRLIHVKGHVQQYIVENNTYKHIPDPETFNYLGQVFGFSWKDSDEISDNEFKRLSSGSTLPSVRQLMNNNEL
jgi:hypothetical protein